MNNIKPLIVANWKCNPASLAQAKKLFGSIKRGLKNIRGAQIVICPPFLYLKDLLKEPSSFKRNSVPLIRIGGQNCFWEKIGAYTGEVSALMLKDLGCQYVIVGHSERRKLGETDEQINKKLKAVIDVKMIPILCIGETKEQREKDETKNVLEKQIERALKDISKFKISRFHRGFSTKSEQNSKLTIAYEPIWAIGTGNACEAEEAQKMRLLIRKIIGRDIEILYGGSVNSKNARGYIKEAGFQGLLVGGASLNPKEFIKIIKRA